MVALAGSAIDYSCRCEGNPSPVDLHDMKLSLKVTSPELGGIYLDSKLFRHHIEEDTYQDDYEDRFWYPCAGP